MPFSLGSKVALIKRQQSSITGNQTLIGYTTIEDHEDLSDENAPLYYIPATDGFLSAGAPRTFTISYGTEYIDLYIIGEGATGACWSLEGNNCDETPCYATGNDGCCSSTCQNNPLCEQCPGSVSVCCGEGIYATGGYGRPHYVRIDLTQSNKFDNLALSVYQFTHQDPRPTTDGGDPTDRSIVVKLERNGESWAEVTYRDAYTQIGGQISTIRTCDSSGVPCNPRCVECFQSYGLGQSSTVTATVSNGVQVETTIYAGNNSNPYSFGTLEHSFYQDFGWGGLTGITWNSYGTGGTGCTVSTISGLTDDTPNVPDACGTEYGSGRAFGRILGIAINPTFTPPAPN